MSLVFDRFIQNQGINSIVPYDGSWGPGIFNTSIRNLSSFTIGGSISNDSLSIAGQGTLSLLYNYDPDSSLSFDFRNLDIFFTSSNMSITPQLRLLSLVTSSIGPIQPIFSNFLNPTINNSQFVWSTNDIRSDFGTIDVSKTFAMEIQITLPQLISATITNLNSIRIPSGGSGGISTINTCGY